MINLLVSLPLQQKEHVIYSAQLLMVSLSMQKKSSEPLGEFLNHVVGTVENLADTGADHIGWRGEDLVARIDTDACCGTVFMDGTQLPGHFAGRAGVAKGNLDTAGSQHLGEHHGGYTHGTDGFASIVSFQNGSFHLGQHGHVDTLEGIGGKVAHGAHAARKGQSVVGAGLILGERFQLATGYTCRFGKDVAVFAGLTIVVGIGDHCQRTLRRKTLVGYIASVEGEKETEGFLQFTAITVATA